MNEIRNELLLIRNLMKEDKEGKQMAIEWLLNSFENDIKSQLKDLEYKKNELENNLETLEYVRKELGIKESE